MLYTYSYIILTYIFGYSLPYLEMEYRFTKVER